MTHESRLSDPLVTHDSRVARLVSRTSRVLGESSVRRESRPAALAAWQVTRWPRRRLAPARHVRRSCVWTIRVYTRPYACSLFYLPLYLLLAVDRKPHFSLLVLLLARCAKPIYRTTTHRRRDAVSEPALPKPTTFLADPRAGGRCSLVVLSSYSSVPQPASFCWGERRAFPFAPVSRPL